MYAHGMFWLCRAVSGSSVFGSMKKGHSVQHDWSCSVERALFQVVHDFLMVVSTWPKHLCHTGCSNKDPVRHASVHSLGFMSADLLGRDKIN